MIVRIFKVPVKAMYRLVEAYSRALCTRDGILFFLDYWFFMVFLNNKISILRKLWFFVIFLIFLRKSFFYFFAVSISSFID